VYGPCDSCDFDVATGQIVHDPHRNHRAPIHPKRRLSGVKYAACVDACDATNYLQSAAVIQAMHVAPGITWTICNQNGTFSYSSTEPDERTVIYPTIISAGVQVLIYNGEADACVPHTDNEWWTSTMKLPIVNDYHPWLIDQAEINVGGYATVYGSNFVYTSIREAGHMVPQTQPAAAYTMMANFLAGNKF